MSDTNTAAADNSGPAIAITGMHKWYGDFHVLKDINLTVERGERIVICGPSGSGKSTMIRCINRLEEHQKGSINVSGIELTNDVKNIDTIRREVGMVFQHFNLFPHLTVLQNCTLAPIWVRKMPKAEAEEIAMKYLTRVKIPEQAGKFPGQLSGGQQQRVAVARALANDPAVVLADEPTANLDLSTGTEIIELLRTMNRDFGVTVISATHDHKMLSVSDRVVWITDGQVDRIALREELDIETVSVAGEEH